MNESTSNQHGGPIGQDHIHPAVDRKPCDIGQHDFRQIRVSEGIHVPDGKSDLLCRKCGSTVPLPPYDELEEKYL